jgi:hypothetical protein
MDEQVTIPEKGTGAYQDYVISLAMGPTLEEGVVNEPRLYYDMLSVDLAAQNVEVQGAPDAIYNRELFPVRLTHLTASTGWATLSQVVPPLFLQLIGLRLRYHDQFYMNPEFVSIAAWANKVVAAPDVNSAAMSAWDFIASGSRPPILAKQDTFQVDVQCDDVDANTISATAPLPVTVSFTGFGALSRRPYFLSGTVLLTAPTKRTSVVASNFRNDGNEPIIITDMTVLVGAQFVNSVLIAGDIRRVSLNVRQVGSGTGSWWLQSNGQLPSLCPAALLGITTGRAVVHQFPGMGQLFGPADGMTLAMQPTKFPVVDNLGHNVPVNVAFVGYIMVT